MQMLMKKKRNLEIAQTIDSALEDYYSGQGKPVPNWKYNRNPQWWIDYLASLDLGPNNELL